MNMFYHVPEGMNKKNAGYEIIDSHPLDRVNHYHVVLGQKKNAEGLITGYVTWEFNMHNGPDSFYWGHYFNEYEDARLDFLSRAGLE